MSAEKKAKEDFLSIVDAVETLSNIADMDFGKEIELVIEQEGEELPKNITYRTFQALKDHDASETIGVVKEVFKVVLDYLKNFYQDDTEIVGDTNTLEGVKGIMVLVGEAAKKLDKYTSEFYERRVDSVTKLQEYRDLQEFYESRISKKIDEGVLGKWILGLAGKKEEKKRRVTRVGKKKGTPPELQSKYVFVDLETVKKDGEYELFYLRKDDGTRFFNPRLIRNMKLVSDFGNYFGTVQEEDPLLDLDVWKDRCAQASAVSLIRMLGNRLERFLHEAAHHRKDELPGTLQKAIMALLLSSHTENLMRNDPVKSCYEYFIDFQNFLNEALHCREYQKLIVYPPRSANRLATCLLETVHALCRGMFIHLRGYHEMIPIIHDLFDGEGLEKARGREKVVSIPSLWHQLSEEYKAMAEKMRLHPNGPLSIILTALENGECHAFSPLRQGNLPVPLYHLYINDKKITSLRIPSPTSQQFVHKVQVEELFSGFLRACESDHIARKNLIINLQDRTSWREVARCEALESLVEIGNFGNHLTVITLAADTDFYHQYSPYSDENEYEIFKEHFMEHVNDDRTGFHFPDKIKQKLFPKFFDKALDTVHRIFFGQKEELSREERLDFISIAYFFLILKVVEMTQPDSFSLTCKDAIDIGGSFNMLLVTMLKLLNNEQFQNADLECLHYLAYLPALTLRERLMVPERFDRVISVIRHLENVQGEYGSKNMALIFEEAFSELYETPILHATFAPPIE